MSSLSAFVDTYCSRTGNTKLKDLLAAFHEHADPTWTRSRLVIELTRLGFALGEVDRVTYVAGLSIPLNYAVEDGKLVRN